MGLGFAALAPEKFEGIRQALNLGRFLPAFMTQGSLVGLLTFAGIAYLLWRAARSGEGAIAGPQRLH